MRFKTAVLTSSMLKHTIICTYVPTVPIDCEISYMFIHFAGWRHRRTDALPDENRCNTLSITDALIYSVSIRA